MSTSPEWDLQSQGLYEHGILFEYDKQPKYIIANYFIQNISQPLNKYNIYLFSIIFCFMILCLNRFLVPVTWHSCPIISSGAVSSHYMADTQYHHLWSGTIRYLAITGWVSVTSTLQVVFFILVEISFSLGFGKYCC